MYDVQIGRWGAVDPLADEYYCHSPYVYTGNDPILFVDPDGRSLDDYKLKQNGEIELITTKPEDKTDRIYATDAADRPIEETSIEVEKSFMESKKTAKDGAGTKFSYYTLNDDAKSDAIFKLFVDNTYIGEWAQIKYGIDKSYISSSGYKGSDGSGVTLTDYLLMNAYTVRSANHSHPSNTLGPSGYKAGQKQHGDLDFANYVHNQYPTSRMKFFIYEVKSGKTIEFNHKQVVK